MQIVHSLLSTVLLPSPVDVALDSPGVGLAATAASPVRLGVVSTVLLVTGDTVAAGTVLCVLRMSASEEFSVSLILRLSSSSSSSGMTIVSCSR
jgi:hypothetical protein